MRNTQNKNNNTIKKMQIIIFIVLLPNIVCQTRCIAQNDNIFLMNIYQHQTGLKITDGYLFENDFYDIEILDKQTNTILYNAVITTPWNTTIITAALPNACIKAPLYEQYQQFIITVSKENYKSLETTIFVLKGRLILVPEQEYLKENQGFYVTVHDQNNQKIQGATVTLNSISSISTTTDAQGKAYLTAPEIDTTKQLTLTAFKEGYKAASIPVQIENIPPTMFLFDQNALYVIYALIILFSAILFVQIRRQIEIKKYHHLSTKSKGNKEKTMIQNQPIHIKHTYQEKSIHNHHEGIHIKEKGAKIEEIRIQTPNIKKETKVITTENKKPVEEKDMEKVANEWFNGTEYMRYKLDEMTGKIDSQTTGKWFEGVDTIKLKVDEKLKQNYKKKAIK